MMKVKRVFDTETERFEVGDKIRIVLQGFGDFTATAHEITDKGTLFIFDDCVCNRRMNETNTNNGGFEKSELCRWMNTELLCAFTDEIRSRMVADENGNYMTVPTYGQIFGKDWDDEWDQENVDIDQREQLPLMEKRKNRITDIQNEWTWYWLQNKLRSSSTFAHVGTTGDASYGGASGSAGVRPAFLIR
jgi:hypothetical protein